MALLSLRLLLPLAATPTGSGAPPLTAAPQPYASCMACRPAPQLIGTGYTTVPRDGVELRFGTDRLLLLLADGAVDAAGQRRDCDAAAPFELGFSTGEWARAANVSFAPGNSQTVVSIPFAPPAAGAVLTQVRYGWGAFGKGPGACALFGGRSFADLPVAPFRVAVSECANTQTSCALGPHEPVWANQCCQTGSEACVAGDGGCQPLAPPAEPPAAAPQARVQCTGPHTLCTHAPCEMVTPTSAVCHCVAVNDTYEVSLDEILNGTLQAETKARCTEASPCELNAAPVCRAVREGGVFGGRAAGPGMVSTFSWAGWCEVNGKYGTYISTPI